MTFRCLLVWLISALCHANEPSLQSIVVVQPPVIEGGGVGAVLPMEDMQLEITEISANEITLRFTSKVLYKYHVSVSSDLDTWTMEGFSMEVEGGASVYDETYEANFFAISEQTVIRISSDSGSLPDSLFFKCLWLGLDANI